MGEGKDVTSKDAKQALLKLDSHVDDHPEKTIIQERNAEERKAEAEQKLREDMLDHV